MPETLSAPESTLIELAQKRHELAIEVAFGGVMNHPDDPLYSKFVPFVDYQVGDDVKKNQLAELAIKELFCSAAVIEKEQTKDKQKMLSPYSEEFLALERPGPYERAYDYILGNRVRDENASIATAILSEFVISVDKRNSEFMKLKEDHFKRTSPTKTERHELNFLPQGQYNQINRAQEFILKKYKLRPATIDDSDKVEEVVKSRIRPIIQPQY